MPAMMVMVMAVVIVRMRHGTSLPARGMHVTETTIFRPPCRRILTAYNGALLARSLNPTNANAVQRMRRPMRIGSRSLRCMRRSRGPCPPSASLSLDFRQPRHEALHDEIDGKDSKPDRRRDPRERRCASAEVRH
jgi:hypothetical protein